MNILGLSIVKNLGMAQSISDIAVKNTLDRTITRQPLDFEDITNAVDFFISDKSKMVTGHILYLGGI